MESEISTEDLLDEVLLEIFSRLSFEDLINSVQYVSSRWREVSRLTRLWKYLVYRPGYDDDDEDIVNILRKAPKLETALLDRVVVGPRVLKTVAKYCKKMKKLELGEYQELSYKLLKELQQRCHCLEHFTIQERVLHDVKKAEIIGEFLNLKTLIIVGDLDNPPESVKLRPIALGCPALEYIDLRCKISRIDDLEYLLLKKKDKLQVLGMTCWTEDGFCTLPMLSACTALKTLRIDCVCQVNIAEGLQSLRNCSTLTRLSCTHLGVVDLNYIMTVFHKRNLNQLVELNISRYVNYEDKLAGVIVESCPQLKKLHLPECWTLTDESLKKLYMLRELQSVDFCGSNVTDEGILYLSQCQQLQYLDLSCCRQLTGQVVKLMAVLSKLKVLILDGCDIQGIPLDIIPTQLKSLNRLSICCCFGVNHEAVARLKRDMPLLKVAE